MQFSFRANLYSRIGEFNRTVTEILLSYGGDAKQSQLTLTLY